MTNSITSGAESQEREAFEAWARSIGKTERDLQREEWDGSGEYSWITERSMWDAWQARSLLAEREVEGWRLVPLELTQAMVDAWEKASPRDIEPDEDRWRRLSDEDQSRIGARANWAAMLAAAPTTKERAA